MGPEPSNTASRPEPEGIAQAFLIAESFIGKDAVTLILGDNIFYGGDGFSRAFGEFKRGATIFGYHVQRPGALWRGGIRRERARDFHRGKAQGAAQQLRRARPVYLSTTRWWASRRT